MESKLEEILARRISDLADEAHPLSVGSEELTRRVRRRRRARNTTLVVAAGAAAATAVGIPQIWAATRPAGNPGTTGSTSPETLVAVAPPSWVNAPPKYCGAARQASPTTPEPGSSGPPDQAALARAAGTIENAIGGGKAVIKGGRRPGSLERWYAGISIDTAWRKVTVYRIPNGRLDKAVCSAVHDVTVEIRGAYRNETDADRIVTRIIGQPKHSDFEIFGVGRLPDGRIDVGTDHPAEAAKALSRYGPGIVTHQSGRSEPLQGRFLGPPSPGLAHNPAPTTPQTTPS
ncbi:hypothetical protein [Actinomadura harenae]|uniref:Uncharacterized protein n=1 Tax=Actinomadura harenae TaxID=2483351 RepID=A0A3M2M0C9_9ACTN|nr:hypothetical protein [Actinomadura harenae]RMI40568.1 hypothetical protein EBO15_25910 [Actinomadura harenae]